ncbi:hypothetical protein AYI69_g2723 [Smittium culicis]|uniref:Retrotransposon-derived protein PEG10 n=1 Tax=Smittium culicis TaxID=133412 RepID=A0A1R1YLV3_9FUNG|nr:hypothetical protein AYI69_g2723 [Smittium culicis]
MMATEIPDSLEDTTKMSVRAENRIYTIYRINADQNQEMNYNAFTQHTPISHSSSDQLSQQENTVYMEIDAITPKPRDTLSEKEKSIRYELGLCLYCRGNGHIVLECCRKLLSAKVNNQQ